MALRTAGLLAGGQGVDLLHEAVAVLERSEARLEHARTLIELGAALRRAGHRADAREPLRAGLELAHGCGARPLVERAMHELLATGAHAPHPRSRRREALTASELRIARMAIEGSTNREIAQALYLSLKTVEMHLGRAYDKLDISLACAARRGPGAN
jgi:DNA-binding CsgD family transcriptional regulator